MALNKFQKHFYIETVILYNQIFFLSFFLSVVQVQLSPFSPHHSPPPQPSPPSTLKPTPFGFFHVSFVYVPWWTFPYFLPLSLSPTPLVTVSLLFISMSLVIFSLLICLFSWLGSTYRWDHIVFVIHCLAYFTAHNVFQFIHVAKGRSSFFLSAV